MKLLTKEIEKQFKKTGRQEEVEDPIVIARFFYPSGTATWYATEYNPEERMFFGYVSLFNDHNNEFGYFSLDELESIRGQFGLGIERDMYFDPKPLSEAKAEDKTDSMRNILEQALDTVAEADSKKYMEDKTTKQLLKIVEEAYKEWDKSNTVFSLSDFEEAVRELTIREEL